MEVSNVIAYLDEGGFLSVVSAIIDNEEHYTADIRNLGVDLEAVFSHRTKDGYTKSNVDKSIELGIYSANDISYKDVANDGVFIWLGLDMKGLKFKIE